MRTLMKRRVTRALVVLAAAFVALLGAGTQAAASTDELVSNVAMAAESVPAPQPVAGDDVGANACWVVAKTAVKIRASASTGSTALGQLNSGERATSSCSATSGGSYTACGGTSKWWVYVVKGSTKGYVAWLCVNWYTDS
jgi:hypothetical protein